MFAKEHKKALEYAKKHHINQKYGKHPYYYHLLQVQAVALEFAIESDHILIACLLHDVLEDTSVTKYDLMLDFDTNVVNMVSAVTNVDKNPVTGIPLRNRKERALYTYPNIAANPDAVLLKLCDRIANCRQSLHELTVKDRGKLGMYIREYGAFRKALYNPQQVEATLLWAELDALLHWKP